MNSPFAWGMKSPMPQPNYMGSRFPDSDKVFSQLVPVQMQLPSGEERKRFLRLNVELISSGLSATSFRKDLHFEITDEEDPYVFYTLRMSEEDFSVLKSQQGLLIDFISFPAKFVQLLERCLAEHQTESPKFLLLLRYQVEMSKPSFHLEIVETNAFKYLCHLSLRLTEGNEQQIKKHLSVKLKQLKEEAECADQKIGTLQEQLEAERKSNAQKGAELDLLRSDFQKKLQDMQQLLKVEHQSEKANLQQQAIELEQQLRQCQLNGAERERGLHNQIHELKEKISSFENSSKDTTVRLVKVEDDCNRLQHELSASRRRETNLDADLHAKERTVNQLRTKVAVLEQELKSKESVFAQQQDLLAAAKEQKIRLSTLLEEKENLIARREAAVKTITEELVKANDIIRKLQTEMRTQNQKLKMRTDIATEQEKILKQRERDIASLQAELNSFKNLNEDLALLKTKIEEKEQTIKSNEQIISYLNKQLNDLQLRADKTTAQTPPWFSTPNDPNGVPPNIPLSTLRPIPLHLTNAQDNRENDEPLDPKYFQPKSYGSRKEKGDEKPTHRPKPSAYFKK